MIDAGGFVIKPAFCSYDNSTTALTMTNSEISYVRGDVGALWLTDGETEEYYRIEITNCIFHHTESSDDSLPRIFYIDHTTGVFYLTDTTLEDYSIDYIEGFYNKFFV
jgi:hypothetical protein